MLSAGAAAALSTTGIDARLAAEIRRVARLADGGGGLHVTGLPLADADAPSGQGAEHRGHVRLLWESANAWLLTGDACAGCLKAWRSNRWSAAAADRRPMRPAGPSMPPAALTWLAALIATYPSDASSRQGTVRLVRPTLRLVTDHRLLPFPGCTRCGVAEGSSDDARDRAARMFDDARFPVEGFRGRPLGEIGDMLARTIVDERCGLVRRIERRDGGTVLPITAAQLFPFEPSYSEHGYGRGGSDTGNAAVALLEAVERYTSLRRPGGMAAVRARYTDLADRANDPAAFVLAAADPSDQPSPAKPGYAPDRLYDWIWGYSFRRRTAVLLPAQLAFHAEGEGERMVRETSSGCAAGSSLPEAAFHGLLEVIERDAFLVHWYAQRPVRRIDPAGCTDAVVRAILARLAAEDWDVDAYDIAAGPAAAAIAVRVLDRATGRGPTCTFAAGAHVDPVAALRGALVEAATSLRRTWPADQLAEAMSHGRKLLGDPARVRTMADHVTQCWPPEAADRCAFTIAPAPPKDWTSYACNAPGHGTPRDLVAALEQLVASTLLQCEDVIVVDQSFAPAAAHGIHCVKVLAPGLLPMTFGHRNRRIAPRRWGANEAATIAPHPFP